MTETLLKNPTIFNVSIMPISATSQTSQAQEQQHAGSSTEGAKSSTSAAAGNLGKEVAANLSAHHNSASGTGSTSSDEGLFARPFQSIKRDAAPPPILVIPLDTKDKPAQITASPTEATENELKQSPTRTMRRSPTPRSGRSPRSPFPQKKGDETFESALARLQLDLNPELKKEAEEALGLTTPSKKD